jgi:hypothetical protein
MEAVLVAALGARGDASTMKAPILLQRILVADEGT